MIRRRLQRISPRRRRGQGFRAAVLLSALLLLLVPRPARAGEDEEQQPGRAQVLFSRARLARAAGKPTEAIRLLGLALKADPAHTGARHLRGVIYAAQSKPKLAERDLLMISYRRPKDVALHRLLARVMLAQAKHMWAARQYQKLTRLTPKAGDVWLGYGYCLYKLGEEAEARKALARAVKLGPNVVANRARLILALLLQKKGKLRDARLQVAGVHGPGAEDAARLTRLIYAAEGLKGRGLTLSFRLGVGYDSNVSMDPVDKRGSGSSGGPLTLGAAASWTAYTWGRHAIGVSGAFTRSFAINTWEAGTCVPDYSMLIGAISPYWSMRLSTGRVDHELRLGYRGQLITLDGDCSEDAKLFVFNESHGGTLSWITRWSDKTQTHFLIDVGYTMFNQQVRDNLGAVFEIGQSIFLAKRRVKLYPELHLGYEHARGAWWSHVAVRPSLALSALLPGKIDLIASVSLEVQRYLDSDDPSLLSIRTWMLPAGEPRSDLIARIGLSVGRAFTDWMRADLAYSYRKNSSNAQPYDYDRHKVLANLTFNVELGRRGAKKKKGGH